ncbi:amidohydrolase family protein [Microbacterium sufflavum]|uniref:Amidohydrolase family protein n=1 Tax=Microbacterium sufflavum TaxID=2851649 RepID=A0ABY4IAX0_9MICO|nr:amidohydrolase family protein [Microbacterium sufflavum]UPL09903.1 amidohydrolase family protein [Microbacterium sufflavum]
MHAATYFDGTRWRDGVVEATAEHVRLRAETPAPGLPRVPGGVVGGFTDHHVHLQLVDHALLRTSRLARVDDLGGNPAVLRELAVHTSATPDHAVEVRYAGAFLTPPGGYPSDRDWAPAGSVREVADEAAAVAAVDELAAAGVALLKVAGNSTAGPVFADALVHAIVERADAHGLPVVVHAEGPDEAQRAVRLGAARLAHAPFTERLDDAEVARHAASVSWISTLAIHDPAALRIAVDNVRRFHAAGGTVLYGTDMGNGPTPVDLHPAELDALRRAGLDDAALLRALAPVDPLQPGALLLLLPDGSTDPFDARPLTPADLKV